MKRKLFLLMLFLTPCLSWAKNTKGPANPDSRAPASMSQVCDQKPSKEKKALNLYSLGTNEQVNSVNSELISIMKQQGTCETANAKSGKF